MIVSMGNFRNGSLLSIGNSGNGSLFSSHNTALSHKQKEVFPTFKDRDLVSADGIFAGQGNKSVSGLYSRKGTLLEARIARQHAQSDGRTPVKRALDMIAQRAYMDWEDGALSQKVGLVLQLFSSQDAESAFPKIDFSEKEEEEKDTADDFSADKDRFQGTKIEPPSEQWSLKTTGEDVVAQMKKGTFLYHVDGGNMYVQGYREDGSLDMQKMCSLDDLRGNLTEDVMDVLTRDDDTKKDDGKRNNMRDGDMPDNDMENSGIRKNDREDSDIKSGNMRNRFLQKER